MLKKAIENLREKKPLVHNITNYVTVNDVANVLLACGGSPIMADDIEDVDDITSICNSLNINIGTLNKHTIESMFAAGRKSNEMGHPIILDPVGAGASTFRTETALEIVKKLNPTVIRGNISEIKTIAYKTGSTKGVDANIEDMITEDTLEEYVAFVKKLAEDTGSIIAVTGAIDIVADDKKAYVIKNGREEMSRVTGTGCQLSGMIGAFVAANLDNMLEAVVAAVITMGLAGEIALEKLLPDEGNATYRNRIIDAICNMNGEVLERGAKYEIM